MAKQQGKSTKGQGSPASRRAPAGKGRTGAAKTTAKPRKVALPKPGRKGAPVATSRPSARVASSPRRAAAGVSTRRATPVKTAAGKAAAPSPRSAPAALTAIEAQQLAHGLNALLHTMHTVQQFEERLCSIMHMLQRGRPTPSLLRELRATLHDLPAEDYRDDVHDLLHALR